MNFDFQLDRIASILEGLEESIVYKLLDRAQFARNPGAYSESESGFPEYPGESLLDVRLKFQEDMDARFGRFEVPEERPFTSKLPVATRSVKDLPVFPLSSLDVISQSAGIKRAYLRLLDDLCANGSDGHLGSSVEHDVAALQAIARRIHFGALYVSEAKFRADPVHYEDLATRGNKDAILQALTRSVVEQKIIQRVGAKVDSIQMQVNHSVRRKIEPRVILDFYQNVVIPLTKEGEVAYLLSRVNQDADQ